MKVCPSCEGINFELISGGVYTRNQYKCLDCDHVFGAPVEVAREETEEDIPAIVAGPEAVDPQESALEEGEPAPAGDLGDDEPFPI